MTVEKSVEKLKLNLKYFMCQYVEPSYLKFLLSIQTTNLLVGKINVNFHWLFPLDVSP